MPNETFWLKLVETAMNKGNRARQRQKQQGAWTNDPPEPSSSEGEPENIRICLEQESDETQRPWWTQLSTSSARAPTDRDVITQLEAKLQLCLNEIARLTQRVAALSDGVTEPDFDEFEGLMHRFMVLTHRR